MEEVTSQESEKKQLEEALAMKELRKGDIVKGIVVQIGEDEVMVDIGGKSEGVIPLRELSCCDIRSPKELFKIGDELEVAVIRVQDDEGKILLSKRKADAEKAWERLKNAMENKTPVEGVVTEVVKGGLLLDLGVQGFLPASLVERGYVEDLSKYVGEKMTVLVIEVRRESRKVILSRKAILEEEFQKKRASLWGELEEGQVRKGLVRRLTNFGAFVDLGGVDGLLHVSEMAWYRVGHPSEILKENDEIEVYILSVDRKNEKVSLSLKKILPNPWQALTEKYRMGQVVMGKIVRLAPFGAFVELEPGIDALVHISQLSDKRIGSPSEVVKVGEEITAKVIDLEIEKHKISLSVKEFLKDKEKARSEEEMDRLRQQQEAAPAPTLGETLNADLSRKLSAAGEQAEPAEAAGQGEPEEAAGQPEPTGETGEQTELAEVADQPETAEAAEQTEPAGETGEQTEPAEVSETTDLATVNSQTGLVTVGEQTGPAGADVSGEPGKEDEEAEETRSEDRL